MKNGKALFLLLPVLLSITSCRLKEGEFSLIVVNNDIPRLQRQHVLKRRFNSYRIHPEVYTILLSRDDQIALEWLITETDYYQSNPGQLDTLLVQTVEYGNERLLGLILLDVFSEEYQQTRQEPLINTIIQRRRYELFSVLAEHGYQPVDKPAVIRSVIENRDMEALDAILESRILTPEDLGEIEYLIEALDSSFPEYLRILINNGWDTQRIFQPDETTIPMNNPIHLGSLINQYQPELVAEFALEDQLEADRDFISIAPGYYRFGQSDGFFYPRGQGGFLLDKGLILQNDRFILGLETNDGFLPISTGPIESIFDAVTPEARRALSRIRLATPEYFHYNTMEIFVPAVGPVSALVFDADEAAAEDPNRLTLTKQEQEPPELIEPPKPVEGYIPLIQLDLPEQGEVYLRIRFDQQDGGRYNISLYSMQNSGLGHIDIFETGNSNYTFRPFESPLMYRQMADLDTGTVVWVYVLYNGSEMEGWVRAVNRLDKNLQSFSFKEPILTPENILN